MYYTPTPFENLILNLLAILIIIIFWWALYAFVSAIFLFIFSKWNKEKIEKAINSLRYMLLWIFLSLFLLFGFPLIAKKIQIPWYEVYTAKNIFNRASTLLKTVISTISWTYKWSWYNTDEKNIDNYNLDTRL